MVISYNKVSMSFCINPFTASPNVKIMSYRSPKFWGILGTIKLLCYRAESIKYKMIHCANKC